MRYLFLALSALMPSSSALAVTHCEVGETVYFSCKIKASSKVVSLCGSAPAQMGDSTKDAWLQYRFGRPGKLELTYPASKEGSLAKFNGFHVRRERGFETHVTFQNLGYRYFVQHMESAEYRFYGVSVAAPGTNLMYASPVKLACLGMPETGGSNFFDLSDILAPDPDEA